MFSNQARTWGCEHEPLARIAYVDVMKTTHKNFVCKQSGLVVSVIHPFIGASPDGQVECDCCGQGVLEIKCLYCIRTEDPNDASFLVNGSLSKKHTYYYQVQTQLFATQAKYADFVVATFAGKVANIVMERISPDENFIEECITKSMYFFKMCILPELLAKWYTRKEVMPTETAAASTSVASNGEYLYVAFSHLALMHIESAFMISYLKRISPNALSMRIKNKPSREVLSCGLMRINMRASCACDTARKNNGTWCGLEQRSNTRINITLGRSKCTGKVGWRVKKPNDL